MLELDRFRTAIADRYAVQEELGRGLGPRAESGQCQDIFGDHGGTPAPGGKLIW